MVKIIYAPWKEIVIHEVIEYTFDEIISIQSVGVPTGGASPPLLWAEGIVFAKTGMVPSPDLVKANLQGRIHYNSVKWAPMTEYRRFIEIRETKVKIPIIDVSANKILSEVAKWLKQPKDTLASAEATKLTKLSEDKLYEMIGEALFAQELLKKPTKLLKSEGIKSIMSKTRKADSRKKGKIFVDKMRERMFKKICVEAQACKWGKHVLKDNKGLVETLVPLIGSIIGFTIPAITIAVAVFVTKRGIREFCRCPPA